MTNMICEFIEYLDTLGFECDDDHGDDDHGDDDVIIYMLDLGEIKVRINKNESTFDLFFDFPYYDIAKNDYREVEEVSEIDDDIESNLISSINKYWVRKNLEKALFKEPQEEIEYYYMCPGSNVFLGYFNCDIATRKSIIECFLAIDNSEIYNTIIPDAVNLLANDYLGARGFSYDDINEWFTCKRQNCTISTNQKILLKDCDVKHLEAIETTFFGKEYTLMKTINGHILSFKNESISEFDELTDILGWFNDMHFSYDSSNHILVATNGLLNMLISLSNTSEEHRNMEYMYLMASFDAISEFRTKADLILCDFSHLTATEFEALCNELLEKKNFKNIHPIGNTNAPDGGRDFLAEEIIDSNIGIEKRVYIVQCKHSKVTLKREMVSEIDSLLRENNAEKYFLICSNNISPQTIDRLEKQNDRRTNKVTYWGQVELSIELQKHKDLMLRYKLLGKSLLPEIFGR